MKTRKRKGEEASASAPSASAEQLPPAESASDAASQKTNDRISFYIDGDGLPQWDRIQSKTVEQLKVIFSDSASQRKLGVDPAVKEAHEVGFDATEANALLDLLQMIKAAGASKVFDVPHEITSKAFTDTELQRSKMVPPVARILNKWGPSILKTWKDEIGAGIIFISVTDAQVQLMRHLEAQRKAKQPQAVREMPNRNVSAGAETPKSKDETAPVAENPVLDSLNATA